MHPRIKLTSNLVAALEQHFLSIPSPGRGGMDDIPVYQNDGYVVYDSIAAGIDFPGPDATQVHVSTGALQKEIVEAFHARATILIEVVSRSAELEVTRNRAHHLGDIIYKRVNTDFCASGMGFVSSLLVLQEDSYEGHIISKIYTAGDINKPADYVGILSMAYTLYFTP